MGRKISMKNAYVIPQKINIIFLSSIIYDFYEGSHFYTSNFVRLLITISPYLYSTNVEGFVG